MEVHRGEVFYADLSPVVGSEQGGIRPVLIVQNEIGNRHSPTVIAAPAHPHQYPGRGHRPCQGQRGAAGADPHAGQTPPAGAGRADHPGGPAAGQSGTGCQPGAGFLLKTTDEKGTKMPLPSGLDEGGICCFVEDLLFTRSWRIPLHRGAALARGSWPAFPR